MEGPMKPPEDAGPLWRWMYRSKMTVDALALKLGVSRPYLSDIRCGKTIPSDKLKAKIEAMTKGEIKAVSWLTPAAVKALAKS